MATSMASGLLFLGGGRCTLDTSNGSIAALLSAFFPTFPSSSSDNRYHLQVSAAPGCAHLYYESEKARHQSLLTAILFGASCLCFQALRHLYVLATRPRSTTAADDGALLADETTAKQDAVSGSPGATIRRGSEPPASEIDLLEAQQFVDAGSDPKPWFANDGLKSFLQRNELSFVSSFLLNLNPPPPETCKFCVSPVVLNLTQTAHVRGPRLSCSTTSLSSMRYCHHFSRSDCQLKSPSTRA